MAIHPSMSIQTSTDSNTPQQDLTPHSNFWDSAINLLLQRQINGKTGRKIKAT